MLNAVLDNIEPGDFSESTKTASQLYAQSLMKDMLMQFQNRSRHNVARSLRAKARIKNRKAKRKT